MLLLESIFRKAAEAEAALEAALNNFKNQQGEEEKENEETNEARDKIIEVLKPNEEKLAAWIFDQPLGSDYDMIKNISTEFKMSLTDAKKAMPVFPDSPLIGEQTLPELIKDLRYMRRKFKGKQRLKISKTIDHLISGYQEHIQKSIDSIYWLKSYQKPLKDMSLTERKLEKIDNIKDEHTRAKLIDSLCEYWECNLNRKSIDYGRKYSDLSLMMKGHKKDFNDIVKNVAHQSLRKDKKEIIKEEVIKTVCEYPGKDVKDIHNLLSNKIKRQTSTQMISKMLRSKGATIIDRKYYLFSDEIKKDIYSYVAGVLDSDGFITMDSKGSPRLGIVATGDRGKAFVKELHKELKVGKLHLDQPGYNETNRTTNRLNFYSMNDIEELLSKSAHYLKMKGPQADLVMECIRIKRNFKKEDWAKPRIQEIFKIIKYENWKDAASTKELDKYDITLDDITKYRKNCKLGLMDEMDSIIKVADSIKIKMYVESIINNWKRDNKESFIIKEIRDEVQRRWERDYPNKDIDRIGSHWHQLISRQLKDLKKFKVLDYVAGIERDEAGKQNNKWVILGDE